MFRNARSIVSYKKATMSPINRVDVQLDSRRKVSIKLIRKLLTNVAAVPRLPKKITRSVFAIANGKDKKYQPHDERKNLKRCEIKQLPNCWLGKPFKVSHFSAPFPSLSLLLRYPHLSPEMRPSVSPPFSLNLTGSSVLRDSRASFSVFFNWPRHHLLVHRRLYTRLSSFSTLLLPSLLCAKYVPERI